ncbi:MAG: GNAT family N-acetyltransferase [Thermoplasmata archaeon]|nr:GNAT family N-acetyltransferase [Thermoplasmata archaeon]
MLIRFARIDDAEKIAKNNVALAIESEGAKIDYEITFEGVKEVIKDENKGFYIVAEENGEIIGQLMVTYEWSDWKAEMIWWLQSIYVKPEWRRKGVMKAMLKKVLEIGRKKEVRRFRLYVHEKNDRAKTAYEKVGMKKTPYIIYEFTALE